jgi:NitT/TauT family transport system substrate-binding protein
MLTLKKWISATAITAFASLATTGAAQAQQPTLKFNYGAPSADYYVLYVAKDLGLFEKHGLEPKFFWFASGAPLLAGLKSESLDIFTTGLATAFALGQGIPVKLLFWEMDDAAAEGVVVNPKTGITSYKDLPKAKAIGAPSGTCAQVALGLIARKIGKKVTDFKVINIAPPLYANAFASGSIDAGVAWAPYAQSLEEKGYKIVNYDADYGIDNGICPVMTGGRGKFLQEHPEVGAKLVQINAEAQEAINKKPQLAIDAMVKYLSITPAAAKATYERLCCQRRPTFEQQLDPNSPYSITSKDGGVVKKLQIATQMLAEAGSIPAPLSAEQIAASIDPSYVKQFVENKKQAK